MGNDEADRFAGALLVVPHGRGYRVHVEAGGTSGQVEPRDDLLDAVGQGGVAATHVRGHVRADIFDRPLGPKGRLAGDLLTRALSIVTLWVLVGRAWDKTTDAFEFGDETNMLGLPIWPVYGFIALAVALTLVVLALQFLSILFSGKAMDD